MDLDQQYSEKFRNSQKPKSSGLETIINRSRFFIIDMTSKVNTIFYGKQELRGNNKRMKNPIDMGILPLLDILNSVDACQLANYALNKIGTSLPKGKAFDPNNRPTDTFGIVKWTFQKTAFDVQTQIDGFYNEVDNIESLTKAASIFNLITQIKNTFSEFTAIFSDQQNPDRFAPMDPDLMLLLEIFPELKRIGNYFNDSLSFFDKFSDFRQLQQSDIDKAVKAIKNIRKYCVLIQSLSDPSNIAAQLGLSAINNFSSDIDRLLKDVDPQKLIPTLKDVNETLKRLISLCNSINSIIALGRLLIKVFLTLVWVFKVITRFLKALPIPNMITSVGVTSTASEIVNDLKTKAATPIQARLTQISSLLSTVSLFLNVLLPIMNEVIQKINTFLASIERCKQNDPLFTFPDSVTNSLKNSISSLQNSVNDLQAFLDEKKQNDLITSNNYRIGEYNISIITENVVEETFGLRRRYGIALNNQGIIQVQSQPTFASDDRVIIDEVKLLLQQKGLIKVSASIYSNDELATITEAKSYLKNDDLNVDLNLDQIDALMRDINENTAEDGSETDIGVESKSFVSRLRRGRRLLRRARRQLLRERQKLNAQLNINRPNSTPPQEFDYDVLVLTKSGYDLINRLNIDPRSKYAISLVKRSGSLIKRLNLKAENDEQAKQIAIETVDPDERERYNYLVKRL